MTKICPSCGNYYKGESCEKCGYGKQNAGSKTLEKYKKSIPKKPVRFMTQEEISLAGKDKKKAEMTRKVDPHARRNVLIAVLIVTFGLIIWVLVSRGMLFTNNREDVIDQYFAALDSEDFDKFTDTLVSEVKAVYVDERDEMDLSKKDYMVKFKEPLRAEYGEGFTIKMTQGKEEKLKEDEIKEGLAGFQKAYKSTPSVSEAYIVYCEVEYSGTKKSETVQYSCYIGKVGWKWKIMNVVFMPGIEKA